MDNRTQLGWILLLVGAISYVYINAYPEMLPGVFWRTYLTYYASLTIFNVVFLMALAIGGFYLVLPSLGDANKFIRSLRATVGIGCPHGFMDNDVCPTCGPSGQLGGDVGLTR